MHRRIVRKARTLFSIAPSVLAAAGMTVLIDVHPVAAQTVTAFDQASNYTAGNGASSQVTTLNGGTGFSSAFREAMNGGGYFIGDATGNGGGGASSNNTTINSANGNSFGVYGGAANNTTGESLQRTLNTALGGAGRTLSFGFDNGYIDTGFTDQFAIGSSTNNNLITFGFLGGGQNYLVNGVDTGLFYTPNGLNVSIKFSSATDYTVTVATLNNPNAPVTVAGTVAAGSTLNTITISNNQNHGGGGYDFFVNNIQVTAAPEPTSLAGMLSGAGMLAGALLLPLGRGRRRVMATVAASRRLR